MTSPGGAGAGGGGESLVFRNTSYDSGEHEEIEMSGRDSKTNASHRSSNF